MNENKESKNQGKETKIIKVRLLMYPSPNLDA